MWYAGADATQAYQAYQAFGQKAASQVPILHVLMDDPSLEADVPLVQWEELPLPESAVQAGVRIQFLWPPSFQGSDWDDIARNSLVARLSFGSADLCFQGDIELAEEATLARYSRDLNCEVSLVGHHGSKYASSSSWLNKMNPTHAIVSFGTNSYGHPTSEALCRVATTVAQIYATHRRGDVVVETDGTSIEVTPDQPETKNYCQPGVDYWGSSTRTSTTTSTKTTTTSQPTGSLTVRASVSNPSPCRYSQVSVYVNVKDSAGSPVGGASVTSSWHYKTTTSTEDGITNADGDAALTRSISSAPANTKDDATGSGSTSFTPVDC